MTQYFEHVKKKQGFSCMHLPMRDGAVDYAEFAKKDFQTLSQAALAAYLQTMAASRRPGRRI